MIGVWALPAGIEENLPMNYGGVRARPSQRVAFRPSQSPRDGRHGVFTQLSNRQSTQNDGGRPPTDNDSFQEDL